MTEKNGKNESKLKIHAEFLDIDTGEVVDSGDFSSLDSVFKRLWKLVMKYEKPFKVIITITLMILLYWFFKK